MKKILSIIIIQMCLFPNCVFSAEDAFLIEENRENTALLSPALNINIPFFGSRFERFYEDPGDKKNQRIKELIMLRSQEPDTHKSAEIDHTLNEILTKMRWKRRPKAQDDFKALRQILLGNDIAANLNAWAGLKEAYPELYATRFVEKWGIDTWQHTLMLVESFERLIRFNEEDQKWFAGRGRKSEKAQRLRMKLDIPLDEDNNLADLEYLRQRLLEIVNNEDKKVYFLMSLLFHDTGKVTLPNKHEYGSRDILKRIFKQIGAGKADMRFYSTLVRWHTYIDLAFISQELNPKFFKMWLYKSWPDEAMRSEFLILLNLVTLFDINSVGEDGLLNNDKLGCYVDFVKNMGNFEKYIDRLVDARISNLFFSFGGVKNLEILQSFYWAVDLLEGDFHKICSDVYCDQIAFLYNAAPAFRMLREKAPENIIKMFVLVAAVVSIIKNDGVIVEDLVFDWRAEYSKFIDEIPLSDFSLANIKQNMIILDGKLNFFGITFINEGTTLYVECIECRIKKNEKRASEILPLEEIKPLSPGSDKLIEQAI
ncbi:MAG: hypothetical protein HY810_06845 [Candidatus Omnitrophica bacterium]|nr:hypothetical protein [Candidatus Omnitrophota bacterium]